MHCLGSTDEGDDDVKVGHIWRDGRQIAAGITVTILSIIGGRILAAKLLRTYLLMYGKRPKPGEIIRNLQRNSQR